MRADRYCTTFAIRRSQHSTDAVIPITTKQVMLGILWKEERTADPQVRHRHPAAVNPILCLHEDGFHNGMFFIYHLQKMRTDPVGARHFRFDQTQPDHIAITVSRYLLSAILLHLKDPSKVIGKTRSYLLAPLECYEQTGLLPNVVFSGERLQISKPIS